MPGSLGKFSSVEQCQGEARGECQSARVFCPTAGGAVDSVTTIDQGAEDPGEQRSNRTPD